MRTPLKAKEDRKALKKEDAEKDWFYSDFNLLSTDRYKIGQKAWEPGGIAEKSTYRHTSRTLIPLGYPFFLTFDFLNLRFSDPPIFRCFEFPNFRFTKLPK